MNSFILSPPSFFSKGSTHGTRTKETPPFLPKNIPMADAVETARDLMREKRLVDMDWRFGITAATSETTAGDKEGNTFLQLRLVLEDGEGVCTQQYVGMPCVRCTEANTSNVLLLEWSQKGSQGTLNAFFYYPLRYLGFLFTSSVGRRVLLCAFRACINNFTFHQAQRGLGSSYKVLF